MLFALLFPAFGTGLESQLEKINTLRKDLAGHGATDQGHEKWQRSSWFSAFNSFCRPLSLFLNISPLSDLSQWMQQHHYIISAEEETNKSLQCPLPRDPSHISQIHNWKAKVNNSCWAIKQSPPLGFLFGKPTWATPLLGLQSHRLIFETEFDRGSGTVKLLVLMPGIIRYGARN